MISARLTDANFDQLGVVTLASPCREPWSKMTGDERVRHCDRCNLNVFALEHLTTDEARALIRRTETGRVCARFYRRFDGTLLTKDCARGFRYGWLKARHWARNRQRPRFGAMVFVMMLLLAFGLGVVTLFGDNIRYLFGMRADGGMGGRDDVTMRQPVTRP